MTGLMAGKRGLIMGLANDKSLAWGIAKALHGAGADVMRKRVAPLAESLGCDFLIDCDVATEAALDDAFARLSARWPTIDFIVHAIGYTNKEALRGKYYDVGLDDFLMTMNISVFSFTAIAKRAAAMMPAYDAETGSGGGAMLTLTYYGAEKVMPHYNVMGVAKAALETSVQYLANDVGPMGIRVNALSAGPIKTLAASGIGDFRVILKWNEYNSPLRRNVTIDDVGGSALYLLSDLSRGVTGETHHVDAGYHTIGMKQEDAPDIATV
jgi:enoyl-[acyl-carrier protein] reductase I